MPKFNITVTEHIERAVEYQVTVTKKQVVDELSLEGEDAKEGKEHVQDYLQTKIDELRETGKLTSGHLQDEIVTQSDVDSVEEYEA